MHELIQATEGPMHALPMSTSVDITPRQPARQRPSSAKGVLMAKGIFEEQQGLQPEDCSDALISWLGSRVATLETALAEEQKAKATIQANWAEAQAEAAVLVEWVRSWDHHA